MSGIKGWRTKSGTPQIIPYFVRISQDMVFGDVVVLHTNTLVSRIAAGIDAELQETTPKGVLGIMWQDFKNDASGQLVQAVPSTVETGAAVIHPAVNYSRIMARANQSLVGTGTDIGNYQCNVAVFNDDLEILLDVTTGGGAYQVTQANRGLAYGLKNVAGRFVIDAAVTGTAAAGTITEVDTTQVNFNVSASSQNACWFRIKPGFQQFNNGQVLHA